MAPFTYLCLAALSLCAAAGSPPTTSPTTPPAATTPSPITTSCILSCHSVASVGGDAVSECERTCEAESRLQSLCAATCEQTLRFIPPSTYTFRASPFNRKQLRVMCQNTCTSMAALGPVGSEEHAKHARASPYDHAQVFTRGSPPFGGIGEHFSLDPMDEFPQTIPAARGEWVAKHDDGHKSVQAVAGRGAHASSGHVHAHTRRNADGFFDGITGVFTAVADKASSIASKAGDWAARKVGTATEEGYAALEEESPELVAGAEVAAEDGALVAA